MIPTPANRRRFVLRLSVLAVVFLVICHPRGMCGKIGPEEVASTAQAGSRQDLLAPMRARLDLRRELAAGAEAGSLRQAELFLLSGDPERAWEIVQDPYGRTRTAHVTSNGLPLHQALRARVAFVLYAFPGARLSIDDLLLNHADRDETRRLQIAWLLATDDLEGLERYCGGIIHADPSNPPALLGRGWLDLKLMAYERSRKWFETALRSASTSVDSVRALEGIADVLYEKQSFDSSLVYLEKALPLEAADDRLLESLALTLIRMGRVGEAIDAAELAVEINPFNERAQYTLGNGYSKLNYSELEAAYPKAFPDPAQAQTLAWVDSTMASGARDEARKRLLEMNQTHTGLTDVHVRLGSLAFEDGDFERALSDFRTGLRACPGNGRARNGISKALEAKRLRIDVHRESYEEQFAEVTWPDVPRIEEFVLNWEYLSDRHKKRVAMSVAPWRQFIPVLVESGSNYYIKPLYQRLSECPGLETLEDQRINYDSRLWDDVRGCGGYSTVTGIEDVERTVLNLYNTVLHELTHQVHSVLTTEETLAVQDLYVRSKDREKNGEKVFISRYQGSSVWEYLAEGANSLMTPRRDSYDTKQIVRERLEKNDPELAGMVRELMSVADMEPYYAVGYANSGYDKLERNLVDDAARQFRRALDRDAGSPEGQAGLIYALSIKGDHDSSCDLAGNALKDNPENAEILLQASRAFYHRDGDIRSRIAGLEAGMDVVEEKNRYLVDMDLADAYLVAGDIQPAVKCYGRVLDYQEDNPEALWGMGIATSLAEDMDSAREYFDKALRRRSGLVDLRTDYAWMLLDAGDLAGASAQLSEAKLLDQGDSGVAAIEGRIASLNGDLSKAILEIERSLDLDPHYNLARALLAEARVESGDPNGAWEELRPLLARIDKASPPEYHYNDKRYTFETIHELTGYDRRLIFKVASEVSRGLGKTADAEHFAKLSSNALRLH